MRVVETCASNRADMQALLEAILQLLEEHGPGARVREAVRRAFPDRVAELLRGIKRRWLGYGVRRMIDCACGRTSIVRIGPGGEVRTARIAVEVWPSANERAPEIPRLPATALGRDTLLAELRRALDEADFARVEQAIGRDEELRETSCAWCGTDLALRASFQEGARWHIARRT